MNEERKPLDFSALDDFQPRKSVSSLQTINRKEIDKAAAFPSREQLDETQINIKASMVIIDRFRSMAEKERYRHGEFLEILMDTYEQRVE
ncbi:hypothetical protein [Bartonella pachyuromydis]|uniref:Uncharacterized protein n=1 Tax=Bartonella pachyuromydis TaxID=931097 RepID=A0ABP8VJC1_9HYPH